jgi:hypothetical protein
MGDEVMFIRGRGFRSKIESNGRQEHEGCQESARHLLQIHRQIQEKDGTDRHYEPVTDSCGVARRTVVPKRGDDAGDNNNNERVICGRRAQENEKNNDTIEQCGCKESLIHIVLL